MVVEEGVERKEDRIDKKKENKEKLEHKTVKNKQQRNKKR